MTPTAKALVYETRPPEPPVRDHLRRRLLALDYPAFARCLCLLLTRLGYEDVRAAGRTARRGRSRGGGHDLEAALPAGLARRRVLVQAKQYDARPVFQRAVDELRGACLRAGAHEGLLVTTSAFSPAVTRSGLLGGAAGPVAPVRLLGGEELLGLMLRHRVGVRDEAGRLTLDRDYFDGLGTEGLMAPSENTEGQDNAHACAGGQKATQIPPDRPPRWTLCIRLTPPRHPQGPGAGRGR